MKSKPDKAVVELPRELVERFQALEQQLWRVDTTLAVCGALIGLLLSYGMLFLADRFGDTPPVLRGLLFALGLGAAAYFAGDWLRLWVLRRRDYRALAELVQAHYQRLGDRLLGIVELADASHRPPDISPALCRAAIRQVSAEAVRFDFRQAVATRRAKLYALGALVLTALVGTPWALVPEASRNALQRWLRPWASVPRYTFVSLESLPRQLVVPHGEPFDIACGVRAHRFYRPRTAACRFEDQPELKVPVRQGRAVFHLPGQTHEGWLTIRAGDVSRRVRIRPVRRPALVQMSARIEPPAYLQYPPAEQEIESGVVTFVEQSHVQFRGRATRALAWARLALETNGPQADLVVHGDAFLSPRLALDGFHRAVFTWRDTLGLEAAAPWPLALQSKPDRPPKAACPELAAAVAMLETETLSIHLTGEDDFGLRRLGVEWVCRKRDATNTTAQSRQWLLEGHPQARTLETNFTFAPALLKLPADSIVELQALAVDYYPGRLPTRSAEHQIYILSREAHAELVQDQFEQISFDLEDLTRRQEGLLEAGKQTRQLPQKAFQGEKGAQQLAEQNAEQQALAQDMKRLAERTAQTLREAMRNSLIPEDTLQQWSQHMQTMQQLSRRDMPQAAQSLNSAQSQAGQRESKLTQALQKEQEILKRMQQMQQQVGRTLDQMLADTIAQRLRKIAALEEALGKSLHDQIEALAGLNPDQLTETQRRQAEQAAGRQQKAGAQAERLTEEISRFYDRTSVTNYGAVAKEMKKTEAADGLAHHADLIRRNITIQAMRQASVWAERFHRWADTIEAARKASSGGGGSGGGGGQIPEAVLQRLLALLRVRMEEVNLRDQTRWLEGHRESLPGYRDAAVGLSLRQTMVVESVRDLERQDPGRFLPAARQAAQEAESLLAQPRTDKPTDDAETDAINLLEAEVQNMMKNSKNPSQAAGMAMLMQMMGMNLAANPTGGGYYGGGEAEGATGHTPGAARGPGAEARTPERTTGAERRVVPVEFRDALQHYHRALERLQP